ncbi:predicted protein [Uncinocarpus reesii 1704]|uniref:Uncharacterized protein n=1 Tax=Uncinocarpus reesii (strain UAMH 1704) TaxID=336963 RepID=C4JJ48_UNCRE|nr:uncharacterized protein UREG_01655 [Uncinocarpus reesii 1704]EEP76806.1 predicted protein [Uncinocarpus reesii 1704]
MEETKANGSQENTGFLWQQAVPMSTPEVKRLHITPLDSALLNAILPPALSSLATDISLHTIQTFPENSYGFVTLPLAEADKLAKKLNGSILRGKKLQIQEARLRKQFPPDEDQSREAACSTPARNTIMAKKRKAGDNAIEGYELDSERRIKRGWTEVPDKGKRSRKSDKTETKADVKHKKTQKSKYTNDPECLFRTIPPPNKVESTEPRKERKKKAGGNGAVVVHEFERLTAHPSFLRDNQGSSAVSLTREYVEGKGWVDRGGNVKETPSIRRNKEPTSRLKPQRKGDLVLSSGNAKGDSTSDDEDDVTSSSGSSSEEESSDGTSSSTDSELLSRKVANSPTSRPKTKTRIAADDDISSSSASSSSEESDDSSSVPSIAKGKPQSNPGARSLHVMSKTSSEDSSSEASSASSSSSSDHDDSEVDEEQSKTPTKSLQSVGPPKEPMSPPKEVHPLEALFKRPATETKKSTGKMQLEIDTGFSFFGNAGENSDIEDNDNNIGNQHSIDTQPQTPFTQRDFQTRSLRSGAPTPDTAAVNKMKFWTDEDEETDEDEDDTDIEAEQELAVAKKLKSIDSRGTKHTGSVAVEESEFSKWFWENRGDNNRAWKKRRREAAKEKRQRENRRGRR